MVEQITESERKRMHRLNKEILNRFFIEVVPSIFCFDYTSLIFKKLLNITTFILLIQMFFSKKNGI